MNKETPNYHCEPDVTPEKPVYDYKNPPIHPDGQLSDEDVIIILRNEITDLEHELEKSRVEQKRLKKELKNSNRGAQVNSIVNMSLTKKSIKMRALLEEAHKTATPEFQKQVRDIIKKI